MSEKMVISFMFQIDTWSVLCFDEIFSGKIKHATLFSVTLSVWDNPGLVNWPIF